jgi:hypothetical protein
MHSSAIVPARQQFTPALPQNWQALPDSQVTKL